MGFPSKQKETEKYELLLQYWITKSGLMNKDFALFTASFSKDMGLFNLDYQSEFEDRLTLTYSIIDRFYNKNFIEEFFIRLQRKPVRLKKNLFRKIITKNNLFRHYSKLDIDYSYMRNYHHKTRCIYPYPDIYKGLPRIEVNQYDQISDGDMYGFVKLVVDQKPKTVEDVEELSIELILFKADYEPITEPELVEQDKLLKYLEHGYLNEDLAMVRKYLRAGRPAKRWVLFNNTKNNVKKLYFKTESLINPKYYYNDFVKILLRYFNQTDDFKKSKVVQNLYALKKKKMLYEKTFIKPASSYLTQFNKINLLRLHDERFLLKKKASLHFYYLYANKIFFRKKKKETKIIDLRSRAKSMYYKGKYLKNIIKERKFRYEKKINVHYQQKAIVDTFVKNTFLKKEYFLYNFDSIYKSKVNPIEQYVIELTEITCISNIVSVVIFLSILMVIRFTIKEVWFLIFKKKN